MKKEMNAISVLKRLTKKSKDNIAEIENREKTKETKDNKIKTQTKKKKATKSSGYNLINQSAFKSASVTNRKFSVYSSLNLLNKNSDLFKSTKNSLATIVKTVYSPQEIKDLIEQTNSSNFENLINKIERALKGKDKQVSIKGVASNITTFIQQLKARGDIEFVEHNADKHVSSMFNQFANGPQALINQVSSVYGDNRYFTENVDAYLGVLTPLFTSFEDIKEADNKLFEVEQYIKDTYKYSFKLTDNNKLNKLNKTFNLINYSNKMDNCINMLYNVAKTFTGTKKVSLKLAQSMLTKEEYNDYLNAKGWFNTSFNAKYEVDDKHQKIKAIFKQHRDTIEDVVATLTTIFMARFVFDHQYFASIERDLTEQACYKMQNLLINKDPNENYWINQLIQDRLKVNIAEVCASNNITNANDLVQIYNNNGTTIVHPEKVTSINDLVFSVQFSNEQGYADNKLLDNIVENKIVAKPTKKSNIKVKPYNLKKEKQNKYLNKLRQTDAYKKYYEEVLSKLSALQFVDTEEIKSQLEEIKAQSNENLQKIENIADKNLTNEDEAALANASALNDAIVDVCNTKLNEEKEVLTPTTEYVGDEAQQLHISDFDLDVEQKPEIVRMFEDTKKESLTDSGEQLSIYDVLEENKNSNDEEDKQLSIFDNMMKDIEIVEPSENAKKINEGLNLILNPEKQEQEDGKATVFFTSQNLKNLKDDELSNKIRKHYQKLINGANGKPGLIAEKLSYRIIDKKSSKKDNSVNDVERLDDKQFNAANKVRDEKVDEIIEKLTNDTVNYYKKQLDTLPEDLKTPKLCTLYFKDMIEIGDDKTFTVRDVKNLISVYITTQVNPELKNLNLELYTGKKTYNKYKEYFNDEENSSKEL